MATTIGNMNGPWAMMLRFMLASYPFLIAWGVWVTGHQYRDISFRGAGERFTKSDAETQTRVMMNDVNLRLTGIEHKLDAMLPAAHLATREEMIALTERFIRLEIKLEETRGD